jgi:hypothetical protein
MKQQPREFETFTKLVDQVLAVPHSVIQKRMEEHRAQADKNPRKRGKKRGARKSPASSRGSDDRA